MNTPLSTLNACSLMFRYAVECEGKSLRHNRLRVIAQALVGLEVCPNLDTVAHYLREKLPPRSWFIYKGGRHVAVHERGLFGNVRRKRFLLIRETELFELKPIPAAARSRQSDSMPVRLIPAFHAPEGAVMHRDLTVLVEGEFYSDERQRAVNLIAGLLVRLRRSPDGVNARERRDLLEHEPTDRVYNPMPDEVERQLKAVAEVLAENLLLFQIGGAYGISFGCSLLVKQYLTKECGERGLGVALNMMPMGERR